MERRQFLIGAGSIITAAFVSQAEIFHSNTTKLFPKVRRFDFRDTIYFVGDGNEYELRLNTPNYELPSITYREAIDKYFGYEIPEDRLLKLSDFRELYHEFGIMPSELDRKADEDFFFQSWARLESPNARAFQRLETLNLFDYSGKAGPKIGELLFIDGYHPGNDYLGVRAESALTATLLQARLLELEEEITIKVVDDSNG